MMKSDSGISSWGTARARQSSMKATGSYGKNELRGEEAGSLREANYTSIKMAKR